MKKCQHCEKDFPIWLTIDGKRKNMQNRKFCIECSPWGLHNTSSDISSSPEERNKSRKEHKKKLTRDNNYKRGWKRKKALIEMSGGSCKCGYHKCDRALSFHHRDPKNKCFGLTLNNLWAKSWETILIEWEKCDLVCMNCHAELENEIAIKKDTRYQKERQKWLNGNLGDEDGFGTASLYGLPKSDESRCRKISRKR